MADDRRDDEADPELSKGLMYVHQKLGAGILKHQELVAHVYALTESLVAVGALELREFEARKARAKGSPVAQDWKRCRSASASRRRASMVPEEEPRGTTKVIGCRVYSTPASF